ncbi:PREDICTED: protein TRIGALACTOSYLDIACYLGLYCEROL 4, chloroplastic [Populus euphratica]|uniref:Protein TRIGALACTOSYLDIACYLGLYCEROL 4, chloroplastic n=1 Tax=Populus euphratica TaxID=75702 RepID=A0AAJ6XUV8_POPEU|nr:PREDICTED: protein TRIGALACTOSYLDIACYLGLYCEROL 4, chloroplastic [Populus euphratica]
MANLRTAMDSQFWDQPISSSQTLEGCAYSIPGDPFPLEVTRASKALRVQQLSVLGNGFPLGTIPSFSPTSTKDLGSFSLQSLFLKLATSNSWLGLIGQFRPKKLISSIKGEFTNADEFEWPAFKDVAKHVFDKSIYSLGLFSQISLSSSSVLLSTERHGDKRRPRYKMMLWHELPDHDITLEAAWPGLFLDQKGKYWDVPESISLDMSSLPSESGFQYRFGVHKNSGHPQPVNTLNGEVPCALMPGLCAKAAFSYEKRKDFWRQKEKVDDTAVKTDRGKVRHPSFDMRLSEPHAAISGIIGGTSAAWFGGSESSPSTESHVDRDTSIGTKKRSPLNANLFGSVCYTFQHGRFTKLYGDLTRVDARLDICSASAVAKRVFNIFRRSSFSNADNPLSSPKLGLILQQQVAGPIMVRVDSKFSLGSSSGKQGPHVEDLICSLSYSLRILRSGKVVAWYSPKRKEGMVELRLFEF